MLDDIPEACRCGGVPDGRRSPWVWRVLASKLTNSGRNLAPTAIVAFRRSRQCPGRRTPQIRNPLCTLEQEVGHLQPPVPGGQGVCTKQSNTASRAATSASPGTPLCAGSPATTTRRRHPELRACALGKLATLNALTPPCAGHKVGDVVVTRSAGSTGRTLAGPTGNVCAWRHWILHQDAPFGEAVAQDQAKEPRANLKLLVDREL